MYGTYSNYLILVAFMVKRLGKYTIHGTYAWLRTPQKKLKTLVWIGGETSNSALLHASNGVSNQ